MIDYQTYLVQNPWWTEPEDIIHDPKIREYNESKVKYRPSEVLDLPLTKGAIHILYGPRQTGKSTAVKLLVQQLLNKKIPPRSLLYFNCDIVADKQELISVVTRFQQMEEHTERYLFLDEVSSIEDWPYGIKWLADAGLLDNMYILLTGSSSIHLKDSGEFLPGRRNGGKDITYLPVSFSSYVHLFHEAPQIVLYDTNAYEQLVQIENRLTEQRINTQSMYRDYLLTGGFLKVIDAQARQNALDDVVEIYRSTILGEIAKDGKKDLSMKAILRKITTSLSSETSYTSIAQEAELGSKNTAIDYLDFLKNTFTLVETLYYNIHEEKYLLKKNKKFYPVDPFFLWIFMSLIYGSNDIRQFYERYQFSPLDSQLAEMFVATELNKMRLDFYYFQNKYELDFYIPSQELGIEIKYRNTITDQDMRSVQYAKQKIIVSKNLLEKRDDILIVPAHLFGFMKLI
jgi:hypothetical protein